MTLTAAEVIHTPGYQSNPGDAANNVGDGIMHSQPPIPEKPQHASDFYSLYPLAVCEGNFSDDDGRTLTRCHTYFSGTPNPSSPNPTTLPFSAKKLRLPFR